MVVYAIVNESERTKFEKEYCIPYGYYTCPLRSTEKEAISIVENTPDRYRKNMIVERWENGEVEEVYRGEWYDRSLDEI